MKEDGYDEYLAQKIAEARADVAAGRVFSLEEARAKWQAVIDELDVEVSSIKLVG